MCYVNIHSPVIFLTATGKNSKYNTRKTLNRNNHSVKKVLLWGGCFSLLLAMQQFIEKYKTLDFTIGSPNIYVTTRWHSIADFTLQLLMRPGTYLPRSKRV